jgi:D-arabinose 1-dehydrogenase-like Zn-dependent alcohol dehydrogenase
MDSLLQRFACSRALIGKLIVGSGPRRVGRIGMDDFVVARHEAFEKNTGRFDFILDTLTVRHDYNAYLNLLRRDGTMVLVALPDPTTLATAPLINEAYEGIMKSDVRYRFVIDIASLKKPQPIPRWDEERYSVAAN